MGNYFLLSLVTLLVFANTAIALPVQTDSLLIVHGSRHYHTDSNTISFSNNTAKSFFEAGKPTIALSQSPIAEDSLWYVDPFKITSEISSRMGEHHLSLARQSNYRFTIVGGYQSACLSRAVADLIANSFHNWQTLTIRLLTRGIFTGFRFKGTELYPSIDQESWADSSIDGLSLYEATKNMTDNEWEAFIRESLRVSIFKTRSLKQLDLQNTKFEIYRNSKKIFTLNMNDSKVLKVIRIKYDDTNNPL